MYRAEFNIKDCEYILDNLREEDRLEVETARGKNWKTEILKDLENSKIPFLLGKTKKENIPVLICGAWCTDINNPAVGIVWLLSTPEIEKHQITFLREMKKEIKKYDEQFGILYNQIYKSNNLAKRWLKWVGFRFPSEEKKLTVLDRIFLSSKPPKDFEVFYRERPTNGLMKG